MDSLESAASLAAWLITEKHTPRNVAVVIACNKYKLPFSSRPDVSKRATDIIKHPKNKMELL